MGFQKTFYFFPKVYHNVNKWFYKFSTSDVFIFIEIYTGQKMKNKGYGRYTKITLEQIHTFSE